MPESKRRKDAKYQHKPAKVRGPAANHSGELADQEEFAPIERKPTPSPRWWAPAMVTLMVLGLVIVVVTYLSQGTLPIAGWGNYNLLLGFGVMFIGFIMTMRWR